MSNLQPHDEFFIKQAVEQASERNKEAIFGPAAQGLRKGYNYLTGGNQQSKPTSNSPFGSAGTQLHGPVGQKPQPGMWNRFTNAANAAGRMVSPYTAWMPHQRARQQLNSVWDWARGR